ncbi:alpha/beta fold hydrolase [Aquisediminimonas sediminicola]|uniref:alpha/beta fold hydrolase n=1 Tax=Alteraquisediminimonas sediminicola TaxID=2676787 RepID=UPI001C8ED8B6|nr:alpha/beta fold hydrolase [Aquisediminimonas sediminicola]
MVRAETAGSPDKQTRVLEGLRRYQQAARETEPTSHRSIAAQQMDAKLWHIPPLRKRPKNWPVRPPVVLIPSIINAHDILDLGREHSLARFLAGRGHPTYLVDWGSPLAETEQLSIDRLITDRLLPLLASLPVPPILIGYCLGGTIAIAAATHLPIHALVTLAAPWHFSRYPESFRQEAAGVWSQGQQAISQWGVMPMEVMQQGFWSIDRTATIAKFERFSQFEEDSPAHKLFVKVEDWANGGAPLSSPAATQLFENLFACDDPGQGYWHIGGQLIDPHKITCPMLHIVSTQDRIVPHASAPDFGTRRDIALGHVGMIIGSRAKSILWNPLARWLAKNHTPPQQNISQMHKN